ncbi:hypothetical protein PF005_g16471 [Phytophthora fragariae]|uniref:Uncharacterized protein n=1 Tax=Phytophthora fragariae TaxID=53985 RepID=A0A6A3TAP5_9STRA|nr:hypothetical protein PF003_g33796 [Phytophthora fragariae]KAE8946296.1 hypothetical protein PF009_g4071 [Phytophthora fragariae]KAE9029275.1 hypothetical protein PF011_g1157 [Phytophthora fragariae]KAE9096627.1 hypothetical protein PF007_g16929 [Phytophthora fragariae]KAE9130552.1 hypothetical protein PF006_g15732 [Phytophthora fragariae]
MLLQWNGVVQYSVLMVVPVCAMPVNNRTTGICDSESTATCASHCGCPSLPY